MPEYRNVSTHPQSLASGRVLGPADSAEVSDDPHDRALIADGMLIPVETETNYDGMHVDQLQSLATDLDVKGTGKDGAVVKADLVKALTNRKTKEV